MRSHVTRWMLCSLVLVVATTGVVSAQVPDLVYSRLLVDADAAHYSPTGELIFPTIIRAADHIATPLATYYLYYAPHDAPGGVAVAYSNSVQGPYTEYSGNPIVSRSHHGRFDVSHVSSPHVTWMPQYGLYFMYFHGENTTTAGPTRAMVCAGTSRATTSPSPPRRGGPATPRRRTRGFTSTPSRASATATPCS